MGKKINHIKIDVGVNSRNTKEIWQKACFKVCVNRTKYRIERFSASIAPSTNSHANQEQGSNAEFGEASGGPNRNSVVSQAASTIKKTSTS